MKRLFILATAFLSLQAAAQHYYQDIVGVQESAHLLKAYQQAKVRRVTLLSFDEKNLPVADFIVTQTFDGRQLRTTTQSGMGSPSVLLSFLDEGGRVVKTVDSNALVRSVTEYQYNAAGQLQKTISTTNDTSGKSAQREEHLWLYSSGKPEKLLRIKNNRDTAFVSFRRDEKGNVVEEQEERRGVRSEPIYYYYNDNNQLTDVVQYNKKARRLLPAYMMEYNEQGQVVQRITVPAGSDNYLIWRYQYNPQGLRTKEVVYNKQKQLTGKVEYQYSFGQ